MNEYEHFKNYIKEKSGTDISVFDTEGVSFTEKGVKISLPVVESVYCDPDTDKTYFPLSPRGKKVVAAVKGAGDAEKKLALLITEIAENFFAKENLGRTDFFRELLFGELNFSQIGKYAAKFALPNSPAFVMYVRFPEKSAEEVKNVLLNYGGNNADTIVPVKEGEFAFVKFCDKTSEEYRSSGDFAEYLLRIVYEETGVYLSVYIGGKVSKISDLAVSFVQAQTAKNFDPNARNFGEIHSYKEYVFMGIMEEIPKYKLLEYLDVLTDENSKEIFEDDEMIYTAEEFLNNSLNVSETARVLYLHRNTLIYRLDKIEKETGLNVRKFSDALTFRLITYLKKLVK